MHVLVVCTANQCRSPMAAALLRAHLARRGARASVSSAAVAYDGGAPATPAAVAALAARGLDLRPHRSTRLTPEHLDADLVLCMTRAHLREVVVLRPDAFPRTFTLKELARRAAAAGPRRPDEDLPAWLDRLGAGRRPVDLLGAADGDDVADPIGRPRAAYEACADELDALLSSVVDLAWP